MTTKNLIALAAVAAALGAAALLTGRRAQPATAHLNGESVFPGLDASAVARIEVGDTLKLAATDEGWKAESYFGYPADRSKIADNLLKLASLKVGQVVRGQKLEKPATLVLKDAAGRALAELPLGAKHAKWGHGRYAAFKGETVLLSDTLDAFEGDGKAWCETKIVDEPWISFNAVVDPKTDAATFGFATGLVARVTIGGNTNRTVTVGATAPNGDRYLKLDAGDWVFTVPNYAVERLKSIAAEAPKAEGAKPEEPKAAETKVEESKAEVAKPEEPKPEEPKSAETKPEEPKKQDAQS